MRARHLLRWGCVPALLVLLTLFVTPGGASAHERRDLAGGKYQVVVGFLNEPAVENQMNGIDLTVTDMSQKDASGKGTPVDGLDKTLKAEVIVGGGSAIKAIPLATRFGMPGKYAGYFMPTQAGAYTFHIFGTINGTPIDERFESGPGRFNDVDPLASLQFPKQVTVPSDLQAQLDAAKSTASSARLFGIIGLVVGVLGLATAGVALSRRPASRAPVTSDELRDQPRDQSRV